MLRSSFDGNDPLRLAFPLIAALLAAPAVASGQPALLHSEPGQGMAMSDPPAGIRLRFNQPMRLDRLQVFDSSGAEQAVRRTRDTTPLVEPRGGLPRLRPGEYRAEWAASSPTGERLDGTLVFRVVEPRPE